MRLSSPSFVEKLSPPFYSTQSNSVSRFRLFLDGDLPSGFGAERNVTLYLTDTKVRCVCARGVRDAVEVVNCTTVFRSVGCNVRYQLSRLLTRQTQVQYSTPLCPTYGWLHV